jgi:L-alanine-DL-glutamate epimerase-like enolase superfamily enzyme
MSLKERAAATIAAGYRAFRLDAAGNPVNTTYNTHQKVHQVAEECEQVREGVGKAGDFCIDFHQRFDLSDAVRCCNLIENFDPYFVEDPVRAEAFNDDIPKLRTMVKVPIAAGEEWGGRWDFNKLVENHDIDYMRGTLPNVGGITEMMKIAALCETHFVGIVPHFTGPIATAALVNSLGTFSGPLLMEYSYAGRDLPHLPVCVDFKDGKLYPNDRPGLGVELDMSKLTQVMEVTQYDTNRAQLYFRPDGSITNW